MTTCEDALPAGWIDKAPVTSASAAAAASQSQAELMESSSSIVRAAFRITQLKPPVLSAPAVELSVVTTVEPTPDSIPTTKRKKPCPALV